MIYITERIANELFDGRQDLAYARMTASGFWDFLVETYPVSHTLPSAEICADARAWFEQRGIAA